MAALPASACERHLGAILDPLDVKPEATRLLARRLLSEFGTLGGVLAATDERIERILSEASAAAGKIAAFRAAMLHGLRTDLSASEVLGDVAALLRLVNARIGHAPNEQLLVLYFDPRHRLIRDEISARGSVSSVVLEPRYILTRALELSATSLILAHNHPSGDARFSRSDRAYTSELSYACRSIGVALLDHIVVASGSHSSCREQGLL